MFLFYVNRTIYLFYVWVEPNFMTVPSDSNFYQLIHVVFALCKSVIKTCTCWSLLYWILELDWFIISPAAVFLTLIISYQQIIQMLKLYNQYYDHETGIYVSHFQQIFKYSVFTNIQLKGVVNRIPPLKNWGNNRKIRHYTTYLQQTFCTSRFIF